MRDFIDLLHDIRLTAQTEPMLGLLWLTTVTSGLVYAIGKALNFI